MRMRNNINWDDLEIKKILENEKWLMPIKESILVSRGYSTLKPDGKFKKFMDCILKNISLRK